MHILVGIDTEGDNQWDPAARAQQRFDNIYGDRCEPLVIDGADSLSIDSPIDWAEAERRLVTQR